MRLLADENVDEEWIRALVADDHDVVRVPDVPSLDAGAEDADVLTAASAIGRVLLTADKSDFGDPPTDDHAGIVIVTDFTRSGGELASGIGRLDRTIPEMAGRIAYLGDWL